MLVPQLAEYVFVGQSTIGISLLKLETPYADPHVRCCERCDAKTSAYSIIACAGWHLLQGFSISEFISPCIGKSFNKRDFFRALCPLSEAAPVCNQG